MVNFKATFTENNNLNAEFIENNNLTAKFGETTKVSTTDYNELYNKPSIESITLIGDKTFKQLGIDALSVQDIEKILYLD